MRINFVRNFIATLGSVRNTIVKSHGLNFGGEHFHVADLSNGFRVSKETVVMRRWERSRQKFGFIKRVDKG